MQVGVKCMQVKLKCMQVRLKCMHLKKRPFEAGFFSSLPNAP
jgi:hypothetical protein